MVDLEKGCRLVEIKLELMDWKQIETTTENQIREAKAIIVMAELARKEAKKQIKSFGGKTSEEEKKEGKMKVEEATANTVRNV